MVEPTTSLAWRMALPLAVLGCGPPATTSTDGTEASTTGPETSTTTGDPSADDTSDGSAGSTGSAGCVDGMPGCPCTPQGECEEGAACAEGECVALTSGCGNGVIDPGEACDDGNLTDADGCNADCVPSGSVRWVVEHQPPEVASSCAHAVAIDSADAIAVAGYEARYDLGLGETRWVTKLDPGGATLWSDPSLDQGVAAAIAVDPLDRWVVAGSAGLAVGEGFARIYEDDGTIVATVTPSVGYWTHAVAVTAEGEVLVAGSSAVQAYDDGSGWVLEPEGYTRALAASPRGGFVVSGQLPDGAFNDAWAAWYPGPGEPAWTHVSQDSPYSDSVRGAALDRAGNVLLAGVVVQGGSTDVWLRKLDPAGTEVWTHTYHSGGTQGDEAWAVATDSHDRVVVVGSEGGVGSEPTEDIWIRKLDPQGEPLWTATHAGPADDYDVARGVAIDAMDEVVVVGCVGIDNYDQHAWIAKYAP